MLKHLLKTALWLLLGLGSPVLWATTDVYKWVDAAGGVHYADKPYSTQARPVNLTSPTTQVTTWTTERRATQTPTLERAPTQDPATTLKDRNTSTPPPAATVAQQININSADAITLAKALQGIGEQRANAIVAHRTKHGPFKSADALSQVKGIGEKTIEKNRARITVK